MCSLNTTNSKIISEYQDNIKLLLGSVNKHVLGKYYKMYRMHTYKSQSSTSSTTLLSGRVGWNWGNIFDTANSQTRSSQSSQSSLTTWTWGLGSGTTSSSDFDVDSGDTDFLTSSSNILSSQHSSVRSRFISVGLNLHTTSNSGDGFLTTQISDMDKGIVERCIDSCNTKNLGSVTGLNNAICFGILLVTHVSFC